MSIPKLDQIIIGERTRWDNGEFTLEARIEPDDDTKPTDYQCYSPEQIEAWRKGEWAFVGLVLDVYYRNIRLVDYAASLWAIAYDLNDDNSYLDEVVKDLEEEALKEGRQTLDEIRSVKAYNRVVTFATLDRMKQSGGNFAARLAGLYAVADDHNRSLLTQAFGPLFDTYADVEKQPQIDTDGA
jgi:hypothetical protein